MVYYRDDLITIRDLHEEDITSLFAWWIDREINKYDPRPIPSNSKQLIEECIRYCNAFQREKICEDKLRKYRYFIICDIENNPLGFVNFFSIDKENRQGELGVVIGEKRYWKKGIAFKAVSYVVDYIFSNMNIDRIYIETGEANTPALKLFKKLKFVQCDEYCDDNFKFIVMERRKNI